MKVALVDTGPLVALLTARDRHHAWAREVFRTLPRPLLTCEAVLTEACFLLARWPDAVDAVLERVDSGVLQVVPMAPEARTLRRLMRQYVSVPMSFADAGLVRLSEFHEDSAVVTIDSDFRIYRRSGRRAVPVIAPSGR